MIRHVLAFVTALLVAALGGCAYEAPAPQLAGQDVRLTLLHTADVHSRIYPYGYAPNTPDRNLGLLVLPGVCQKGICSSDVTRACQADNDCQSFPTASVGGLGRMATLLKRERIGAPRVLHLDSGDMFQGAPVFNLFNGETEVRSMGLLGVQGMALGNHEFDKGATLLGLQLMNNGPTFPIMAANYEWLDPEDPRNPKLRRFIPPYMIYNVKGLRVGVIGLGNLSSLNSAVEGDNSLGLRALDSKQAVAQLVPLIRPQVDLMILLSHLGPDDDAAVAREVSEQESEELPDDPNATAGFAVPGIDIILGGHLHVVYNPPVDVPHYDKEGHFLGRTVIVNSGAFAKFFGVLDTVVQVGDPAAADPLKRTTFLKSYTYKVVPIADRLWRTGDATDLCDPSVRCDPPHPNNPVVNCSDPMHPKVQPSVVCAPPDPDMSRLLEPYSIKMKTLLNLSQVYAVVPCDFTRTTCPKVLRNDPGGGDSQLGNLVATSMRLRRRVEADFALTNALGIRADFESGPLTLETMFNVFPFDNTITTMFLSGDEILQMVDFVAERSAERGCRTQVQVAGIAFTVYCDNKPRATWTVPRSCAQRLRASPTEKASWIGSFGDDIVLGDGCRLPDGGVDTKKCKPIDCFGSYKVAVNDYIAIGGSGFAVLKRNTTRFNTGISLRDALVDYIRGLGAGDIPEPYLGTKKDPPAPQFRCLDTTKWRNLTGADRSGAFDYTGITCLRPDAQAHDGRIRPVVR